MDLDFAAVSEVRKLSQKYFSAPDKRDNLGIIGHIFP